MDGLGFPPTWRRSARAGARIQPPPWRRSLATLAIWPEDIDALAAQRADVLVTHEAPSSHPSGLATIDALARAMGAGLVVHGHHHVGYRAHATDGLQVLGVAAAWGITLGGRACWPGEPERVLSGLPPGWSPTRHQGGRD